MTDPAPRAYHKRKRAWTEARTRLRITEAAVELHGSVGPARTSVTEVAKRAGVSRMTVYNHFPTEVDLFTACSSHWAALNPFPDPSRWDRADPAERLVLALEELYGWYAPNRSMLGNVLRDAPSVPALAEVMGALWSPFMDRVVGALADGWSCAEESPVSLRAMLRVAVDFGTWERLAESGLNPAEAARLAARMVTGAVGG
jgi:AcrR family transcriptional regulator